MKNTFFATGLFALLATAFSFGADSRASSDNASYLIVNGVVSDYVRSWQGGQPRGVVAKAGAEKHISAVVYDPLVLEVAAPFSSQLVGVIDSFLAGQSAPVTLLLKTAQTSSEPALQASNVRLVKVEFPSLDGAAKDLIYARLTFAVSGATTSVTVEPAKEGYVKRKGSLASNFQFLMDGLPTQRVAGIAAWSVSAEGAGNDSSNLTLSISSADKAAWIAWRDQFLIQGQNGNAQEKNGAINIMDATLKNPSMSFAFSHLGMINLEPADDGAISRFNVELYFEGVRLNRSQSQEGDERAKGPTPTPAPKTLDLRQKQAELAELQLRKKALQQTIVTRETEMKDLEPKADQVWEKSRLPVVKKAITDSKSELAQVDRRLSAVQAEIDSATAK